MQIILMRHGKPDIPETGNLSANEIHQWVKRYNAAPVTPENLPPAEITTIARECNVVVCSDLPRSISSAEMLGVKTIHYAESLYQEMGLPYGKFFSPRLPPMVWVVFFRILWHLGYSSNSESVRAAKRRVTEAVNKLICMANEHESVLLVGHGYLNRYIAKELQSFGWKGPTSPGNTYWGFGIYEKNKS